jgi:hypothetical protein
MQYAREGCVLLLAMSRPGRVTANLAATLVKSINRV